MPLCRRKFRWSFVEQYMENSTRGVAQANFIARLLRGPSQNICRRSRSPHFIFSERLPVRWETPLTFLLTLIKSKTETCRLQLARDDRNSITQRQSTTIMSRRLSTYNTVSLGGGQPRFAAPTSNGPTAGEATYLTPTKMSNTSFPAAHPPPLRAKCHASEVTSRDHQMCDFSFPYVPSLGHDDSRSPRTVFGDIWAEDEGESADPHSVARFALPTIRLRPRTSRGLNPQPMQSNPAHTNMWMVRTSGALPQLPLFPQDLGRPSTRPLQLSFRPSAKECSSALDIPSMDPTCNA